MAEGKPSSASQSLTPIALCRLKLQKSWNNVLKDIIEKPKIWPDSIRFLTILHGRSRLDIRFAKEVSNSLSKKKIDSFLQSNNKRKTFKFFFQGV